MAKNIFVTGVSGYIGGSIAARLVSAGYNVSGLVRNEAAASRLKSIGITPVSGDLSETKLLIDYAMGADAVINAADADNEAAVKVFLSALKGSDKVFIHTSGSSIVADQADGEPSDEVFSETTKFTPQEHKKARVAIDQMVVQSAKDGLRPVVICPCLIYGKGLGIKSESVQIPLLIKQAIKSGVPRCVGRGKNIWSNVHIEDLTDLYLLVLEKKPAGGLFLFAENDEVTFRELAEKVREGLSLKAEVEEWPRSAAVAEWGMEAAVFALGSNSRVRGEQSRALGWTPRHKSVLTDVLRTCSVMREPTKV